MVNVYNGSIKMLEHALRVLERVIEEIVWKIVKIKIIDNMQFGFMAGWSKTGAILIVRQLQEKYLAKKKDLWIAFADLEKAFLIGYLGRWFGEHWDIWVWMSE